MRELKFPELTLTSSKPSLEEPDRGKNGYTK